MNIHTKLIIDRFCGILQAITTAVANLKINTQTIIKLFKIFFLKHRSKTYFALLILFPFAMKYSLGSLFRYRVLTTTSSTLYAENMDIINDTVRTNPMRTRHSTLLYMARGKYPLLLHSKNRAASYEQVYQYLRRYCEEQKAVGLEHEAAVFNYTRTQAPKDLAVVETLAIQLEDAWYTRARYVDITKMIRLVATLCFVPSIHDNECQRLINSYDAQDDRRQFTTGKKTSWNPFTISDEDDQFWSSHQE